MLAKGALLPETLSCSQRKDEGIARTIHFMKEGME
jgi:hypothetical protein